MATPRSRADSLLVGCFEGERPSLGQFPKEIREYIGTVIRQRRWKGLAKQSAEILVDDRVSSVRVVGLGKRSEFDGWTLNRWLARGTEVAAHNRHRSLIVHLPEDDSARGLQNARRLVSTLAGSGYRFEKFRTGEAAERVTRVFIAPPDGEAEVYRRALGSGHAIASGIGLTRELGDTPPNVATPVWMAERCRDLASEHEMKIRVLGPKALENRGMGGILAVGKGSDHEPRLVRLEWGSGDRVISMVGKGVTFDTGGISIKPAAAMHEMKYDKCGACTVMGIAKASAQLDLPYRFRAYLPLVENMPDGTSYRPGDIVRCYNGKTVEILNTDAEGRMILADALAWAAEEDPSVLLEYSTLTGACVVALGHAAAGLYTPDDPLAEELVVAGQGSGDRLWRMPLFNDFKDEMKGRHGDLKNVAGRWGGANTAAAFLSNFVGSVERWAHLDIAGTAYIGAGQSGSKGATGFGVGLTLHWLLNDDSESSSK